MNASIITVHMIDLVFAKFQLTLKCVDHRWILKDKAGDVLYCCYCQHIPRKRPKTNNGLVHWLSLCATSGTELPLVVRGGMSKYLKKNLIN